MFIIITCAHNFVMFASSQDTPLIAKPHDAIFYLQNDGNQNKWLIKMNVSDISIYPKYFEHKNILKGSDFALAVVEISANE